jgi:hypothetical protein
MGGYTPFGDAGKGRVQTSSAGTCASCDARLSIYRPAGETRCAPCIAARPVTLAGRR